MSNFYNFAPRITLVDSSVTTSMPSRASWQPSVRIAPIRARTVQTVLCRAPGRDGCGSRVHTILASFATSTAATLQTAVILVVAGRYSSGLLSFAAHSPEDSQRDRKCRSARFERTVPWGLFQYRTIRRISLVKRQPQGPRCDPRPGRLRG
jgi:hypothetical protein